MIVAARENALKRKELVIVAAREDVKLKAGVLFMASELVVATGLIVEGQVMTMELIVIGLVVTFGQFVLLVFPVLKQKVKKFLCRGCCVWIYKLVMEQM